MSRFALPWSKRVAHVSARFCGYCGGLLIEVIDPTPRHRFDPYTGERVSDRYVWRCQNDPDKDAYVATAHGSRWTGHPMPPPPSERD